MNDHSLGLGVSPGWTKTQATEPADHNLQKTCKQFDVFLPLLYLNSARVTNLDAAIKYNTTYYSYCNRKVLKDVVDNNCWMPGNSQPDDHISNGILPHFDSYDKKLSRHTNLALNTAPCHNNNLGVADFLCN